MEQIAAKNNRIEDMFEETLREISCGKTDFINVTLSEIIEDASAGMNIKVAGNEISD
jgi:pimeloyl-CoA synthetase